MDTIVSTIRKAMDAQRPSRPPARESQLPRLADVKEAKPLLLRASSCVREALSALSARPLRGCLVVGEDGLPVGELSVATCLRVLATGAYHAQSFDGCRCIRDVMRSDPVIVDEEADPFSVAQQLLARGHEVAAVMREGQLQGTVSQADLLALLARVSDPDCDTRTRQECQGRRSSRTISP